MKTGEEVQAHILLKAADDTAFRSRLRSDPKGVIEAETGKALPDDMLVFVTNAIETSDQPKIAIDAPLTADELSEVMGGDCEDGTNEEWHDCD
ncbi:MAG: hypothetical protein J4F35_07020 [Candidatus Latescibacteria bacterium]|nr:hypothetical protein [Candidatus Latescibacterota bacterium]